VRQIDPGKYRSHRDRQAAKERRRSAWGGHVGNAERPGPAPVAPEPPQSFDRQGAGPHSGQGKSRIVHNTIMPQEC